MLSLIANQMLSLKTNLSSIQKRFTLLNLGVDLRDAFDPRSAFSFLGLNSNVDDVLGVFVLVVLKASLSRARFPQAILAAGDYLGRVRRYRLWRD